MPLVRISVRQGTSPEYRKAIGEAVHRAMVEALAVPQDDHFQIITEHSPEGLIYDPQYLGMDRSDAVVFIQIFFNAGRSVDVKRRLYAGIVENLAAAGVRGDDILINLVEMAQENWSFGRGELSYPPAAASSTATTGS